jgi:succinate dehydrogenase / fumarate reductase iron-sulfur subunit
MGQIMRLRRIATNDQQIVDKNNGERHEAAFTTLIKDNGLLWEAELLPRSYGGNSWFGKFAPPAGKELLSSLPAILKALLRGKVTPMGALKPHKIPKQDLKSVQGIFDKVEGREQRYELNLYIAGEAPQQGGEDRGESGAASASDPVAAGVTAETGGKEPDSDPGSEPADTPTEQRDSEEGLGK